MMLKFAALLWITVFRVDAASHQSLSKESSMRSLPPESQLRTRRLTIFESFAKSDDQRDDDLQSPPEATELHQDSNNSDDDKTVNENLKQSLVELTEIVEGMKTPVIPNESAKSLIVFQSLSRMLSNAYRKQSGSPSPWPKDLSECIRNLKCSVKDLCEEFNWNFKCNQEGHLSVIVLRGNGPFAHLNLRMIPNTVERFSMKSCGLTSISAWSELKGKSLKSLRINEYFKLNLDGLQGTLDDLPLVQLSVGRWQVSEYFGLQTQSVDALSDSALTKIGEWMRSSTLVNLRIVSRNSRHTNNRNRRNICFCRNGKWRLE